jgi:hypothetical protein
MRRAFRTTPVETATFAFVDGNQSTFARTVMVALLPAPVSQTRLITRFRFAATGGVICQ